ncbi:MAG: hypothetical protein AB7I98_03865 [Verrucomicrobiales bacterium]
MNREGVQAFEAKALAASLEIDGERVIIGETPVESAGVYEISAGQEIGSLAGIERKEELSIELLKTEFQGEPTEGLLVAARGKSWRVSAVFGRGESDIAWYLRVEKQ